MRLKVIKMSEEVEEKEKQVHKEENLIRGREIMGKDDEKPYLNKLLQNFDGFYRTVMDGKQLGDRILALYMLDNLKGTETEALYAGLAIALASDLEVELSRANETGEQAQVLRGGESREQKRAQDYSNSVQLMRAMIGYCQDRAGDYLDQPATSIPTNNYTGKD